MNQYRLVVKWRGGNFSANFFHKTSRKIDFNNNNKNCSYQSVKKIYSFSTYCHVCPKTTKWIRITLKHKNYQCKMTQHDIYWRKLTYIDAKWRKLTYIDAKWRKLKWQKIALTFNSTSLIVLHHDWWNDLKGQFSLLTSEITFSWFIPTSWSYVASNHSFQNLIITHLALEFGLGFDKSHTSLLILVQI